MENQNEEVRYTTAGMTEEERKELDKRFNKKANIEVGGNTAFAIRQLAGDEGFFISRGPGAGETGSIKLLLDKIAECYWEYPEAARFALHMFFVKFHTYAEHHLQEEEGLDVEKRA